MEIRNMLIRQTTAGADQPLLLQKGQIYEVTVKEVKGNEAVVHIKGIDVKVRAEGEWPKEGRAAIQIVNEQDGFPIARIVSRPQTEAVEQMTRSAVSEPLSSELKQIELWLQKQGQPLTKETISTLRTFFAESSGTVEQKLDTVRAVINKKLELTSTHLTAVHEALHGPPFGERLAAVAKKLDPTFVRGNEVVQSTENETTPPHSLNMDDHSERMQKPVTDTFSSGADQGNRTADRIRELAAKELPTKSLLPEETVYSRDGGQKTKESPDKDNIWHTSSQAAWAEKPPASERSTRFHQLREQVIREPNVSKAVEYARRQVVEAPDVDRNVAERVDRTLREVVQLQRQGRDGEARARLNQALMQVEQEVRASEAGNRVNEKASRTLDNVAKQLRELRTEAARSFDLSKVLTQVREQLVDRDQVPMEVREKAAAALKEAQLLRANGQEASARRHLVQALEEMEQAVRAEKLSTNSETAARIQQVRDQIAREPNVSKAVEYARRQVVEAPDVGRSVAEQVDRALREVVQLQRQGRESEARVRLNQALMQVEQEVRAPEEGNRVSEKASRTLDNVAKQLRELRTEAARSFDLSKVLTQVREQLVDRDQVPVEVREKAAAALKEAQLLRANGQEASARRHLVQALDEMEQAVRAEKLSTGGETATRIRQVRDEIAREPNVSKAVEYARRQVVEAPDVDRNVAEQVDRALREVVQLQRQGRESEARVRLNQALMQMEQEVRISETGQQPKHQMSYDPRDLAKQIGDIRTEAARSFDLSKVLTQVREQLVDRDQVPMEVREKAAAALKEAQLLRANGQEASARRHLVQALDEMEQAVRTEKLSTNSETAARIQQVRDQIAREPNVSKAVEYARRQVVEAPDVDRNVAERVDRTLREVVQLQRQGRESEARARLNQALEETVQAVHTEKSSSSGETISRIHQVRDKIAREPNVSKAVEYARRQVVEAPDVDRNVAEQVDRALREVVQLQRQGRESEARVRLNQALEETVQAVHTEKSSSSGETISRIHQVRDQIAREPNVSKAVEYARRQVVEAPDVDRNVAERVDRALREVVQLQRQGREGEARVRLNQALMQVEQEVRIPETGQQPKHQMSYDPRDLAKQIGDIRTEAARTRDLSVVLPRIRSRLVEDGRVPEVVRQKVEVVLKETIWLQQINQHRLAQTYLVRQLAQLEQMAAVGHTVGPTSPVSTGQAANVQETADGAVGKEAARTSAASPLEPMESVIEHEPPRHAPLANVQETDAAQRTGQIYEAIRQAIKLFQHEPIFDKALDVVQGKMREALHSQPHWRQSWNDAFAKAMELKEKGRELAARQTVLKTLNEIESSLSSTLNDRPANVDALFDGAWQAGLSLETKDFLVQTVTKKMAQAARDFQTVKRDVMRHLETALQWTEQGGQAARLQARQLLETAIKQLDNTILKSDIMLFTDMVTEKRLMKASSQLAEAKKRLQQGDEHGARTIVKEVKDVLANIVLKPSEAKVKHFVAGLGEPQGDLSETFFRQMNEAAQPFVDGPSARQLFEALRRFGFMHDYEAAESLVQKDANGEGTPQNMKAMLLQLAQSGNEPIARQAEQALTNLTGQQLLNRWDAGAGMQSLFFSLPLLWQNEVRNVNVYVNARQDGERIDWENCRLYFLLETKKLGDLGILLQANERHLSITLRNDREDFAEKASPFIDAAKKRLEEIGYRVISVNVTKLTNETKRQEEEKRAPSARLSAPFTERGYDFTI